LCLDGEIVDVGSAVEVECSVPIALANGAAEAEVLLLQGRPLAEPVVQHGPFVMNSLDEIRQAYADYRESRFGGWGWPTNEPDHGSEKGRFVAELTDPSVSTPPARPAPRRYRPPRSP
jgi:hypothetical protein